MRRILVVLVISSIICPRIEAREAMQSAPATSQVDDNAWRQLQKLESGTQIRITTVSGAEIDGRLSAITQETLSMEQTRLRSGDSVSVQGIGTLGTTVMFARTELVSVRAVRSRHVGRWVAIAAATAGLLLLLSPAGQCILAGPNCS